MDLEELKLLLQKDKGKIIIVENGKPLMVILPYESPSANDLLQEASESLEETPEPGELTIDDLPI